MRRQLCSAKAARRRLPPLAWLPRYSCEDAVADLIAGVTIALTIIPQSIAYAFVAELPPQVLPCDTTVPSICT